MEPQLDTSAMGRLAPSINCRAASMAEARSTGWPFCIACVARGRSKICARSRPLLQIQGPLTCGFSSGVTRSILTFWRWVERVELPFGLAMPDLDRAAARASRADGGSRLEIPDSCLVQERTREQRADRTEVDDVVRVRVGVERPVFGGANQRRIAALGDAQRIRLRYFAREAHATRAQDAALIVEHDALGERVELGRAHLRRRAISTASHCICSGSPAACIRRPCRRCRSRPDD